MQSCHRQSFYKNIFSVNGFHIFTVKYLQPIWMFLLFEIDGLKNVKSTKFRPFHNCFFFLFFLEWSKEAPVMLLFFSQVHGTMRKDSLLQHMSQTMVIGRSFR